MIKFLNNRRPIQKTIRIIKNFKSDEEVYKWQCEEYEKKVYGNVCSKKYNYKKEMLKEKLWNNVPLWRFMIKCYHKIK